MSHSSTPVLKVVTIPQDRSPVDFDCQAFAIWGMNAMVVSVPAISPSVVTSSTSYTGHFSSRQAMSQNIHSYRELMMNESSIRRNSSFPAVLAH